jgi:uncharacterized protein (DUF2141 family)
MKPAHQKILSTLINSIMLCSMLLGLVSPAVFLGANRAYAQDITAEGTEELLASAAATETPSPTAEVPEILSEEPQPTAAATEPPTESNSDTSDEAAPTAEINDEVESTAEPTAPAIETEATEPTTTLPPTQTVEPGDITMFTENFEDGDASGWNLEPGWAVTTGTNNLFLRGIVPGSKAVVDAIDWAHLSLKVRLRVQPDNAALIIIRQANNENYTVTLNAAGHTALYRGADLLAQSAEDVEEVTEAVWRTVGLQALGGQIIVTLDDVVQFTVDDPDPLGSGAIAFMTDTQNSGAVDLDDVFILKLDAPAIIVQEPTLEPTPDELPTIEATLEPEATAEATEEPTAPDYVALPIASADFESELTNWAMTDGAVIVAADEASKALLLNSDSSLLPQNLPDLYNLRLEARINLLSDTDGAFHTLLRSKDGSGYVIALDANQIMLSRAGSDGLTLLAQAPVSLLLNNWYTLTIDVVEGQITAAIDGSPLLTYTDSDPLPAGQVALAANGGLSLFVDDVILSELVDPAQLPVPTPVPLNLLTEEGTLKLSDNLVQVLQLYETGDLAAMHELAQSVGVIFLDDSLNLEIVVWPTAELDTLAAAVEMAGGLVVETYDQNLSARISLSGLLALINMETVLAVRLPDVAASTDLSPSAALAPAQQGGILPHSLAVIGWNDWNLNSVTGAGIRVAVIDRAGTHRQAAVDLIRTIAPGAIVTPYTATNASTLGSAIASARSGGNRIILITMDLGAHVSPGDGTASAGSTVGDAGPVYTQIQLARQEGRLVIVSAGNNTGSYVSFNYTNASTTVNIQAEPGPFVINVSWNDWGGTSNLRSSISGTGITSQSSTKHPTAPSYQYNGTCTPGPCNIALAFNSANPTGRYVQVQLNSPGSITGVTGSTIDTTAGNIGRPADSPFALAVGAVCSVFNTHTPLTNSSHGPIFRSGGSGSGVNTVTGTRLDYKPDLVAPSHVYSPYYNTPSGFEVDCNDSTTGFNGTSAASAHVAGMAALLLSNNRMAAQIGNAINSADALQNYLQTHSIDLIAAAGDGFAADYGFDNVSGSGLTTLGNPLYDLSQVVNPLESGGNAIYVGLADPGSPQTGAFDAPYIHPAKAIAEAAKPDRPDRIVFLPGEYPSGLGIIDRDGLSLESYNNRATFWVNDSYQGVAGIMLRGSTDIVLDGFNFQSANPLTHFTFSRPAGVQFYNLTLASANGSVVRSSTFTGFSTDTALIVQNTVGVNLFNNTFENINIRNSSIDPAAVLIIDSPTTTEPVTLRGNQFRNVIGTVAPATSNRESIIRIQNSAVNIYSNLFQNTDAETILNVANTLNNGTTVVNVFSNLFLNNRNLVALLSPAPEFRFINNTVVGQTMDTGDRVAILRLGTLDGNMPWAVHNNLFYNNGNNVAGYRLLEHSGIFSSCRSLDFPAVNDTGARNNWIINTQASFGSSTCDVSLALGGNPDTPNNNNLISVASINPIDIFLGADPFFDLTPTDPLYYQLRQEAQGIDRGDNAVLVPPFIDFTENIRFSDGNEDDVDEPDMGAFELVPLATEPIVLFREEDVFDQANDRSTAFGIDLRRGVTGGFPPFTYRIRTYPANFSTDPSDFCLGAGLRIVGNYAYYCPPEHFYTSTTNPDIPDNVQFEFYAFDRIADPNDLANASYNSVTINIQPMADLPLTAPIDYQLVAEAGNAFRFRLRPSVRFNNYRFSESGTIRDRQADYPFIYNTDIEILELDNPNILETGGLGLEEYIENRLQNRNPDGTVTLQSRNGERGSVRFRYQVTDSSNPPSSIWNTVVLEVTGVVPNRGLHDDASFSFRYNTLDTASGATSAWQAVASTGNINNTLHETSRLNDVANFDFVGEGFIAYLQAQSNGARWELRVDNRNGSKPPLQWVQQPNGNWLATGDGFTCITRAPVINNQISNMGTSLYTVSCDGLRPEESHSVEFINRENRRRLSIDAFAIMFESDPLQPGFHEVTEHAVLAAFAGWETITDRSASNGVALATQSSLLSDVIFRFSGTGIALGTTLERVSTTTGFTGAEYDICITPQFNLTPGEEVCQRFNNSVGAATRPTWNVFRPFLGYNYNPLAPMPDAHTVRIRVRSIPAGARLVIDSIKVFDDQPTSALNLTDRVTQDDQLGPIVFGSGMPTPSWELNTSNRSASNTSLTSLIRLVTAAGPIIAFQIPNEADLIHWYRIPGRGDSQNLLICVDRGQGEDATDNRCLTYNLRTAPNPLIIRETDFGGWGEAWGSGNTHTVEIFSLVNEPFNFDKVEIFNSNAPFSAGFYEDYVLAANNNAFGFFDDAAGNPLNGGSFQIVQGTSVSRTSARSVARTTTPGEGALFQINGTGFTVYFSQDRLSGNAQICWLTGTATNQVSAFDGAENCRTVTNYSGSVAYQVGYSIFGLPLGTHTVLVRNLTHPTYLTSKMDLDGILVTNDVLPGNILTNANPRYETSFTNRVEENRFLYYGNWSSVGGKSASRFSGSSYDLVQRNIGAGLVFQTQGVDTLRIVRTARRGNADMQICVNGSANCLNVPGDRDPAIVHLDELVNGAFSLVNPYIVSISLTTGGRFELDAIDVFNSSVPLTPARYEDDDPRLRYDTGWNNKVSGSYTNRRGQRTATTGAEMLFHMEGSMLELGAFVRAYNQVQICYVTGIVTDSALLNNQNCQNFPTNAGQSLSPRQVFGTSLSNGADIYTVRIRNLSPVEMVLDYIHVLDEFNPLIAGRYENNHPQILAGLNNGQPHNWQTLLSRNASEGAYLQTLAVNDFLQFEIEGTGFGIGTFINRSGSEMRICYERSPFDGSFSNGNEACVDFQNENTVNSSNITRAVAGLPQGVYTVGVFNLDNGQLDSSIPPVPRDPLTRPPTLVIDFVEVYDQQPALLTAADGGAYNEDAANTSGDPYARLLPSSQWLIVTDRTAKDATEGSYTSVIDARSRPTNLYAGQSIVFRVELPDDAAPGATNTTFILDILTADAKNSSQLQYCVVGGATPDAFDIECDVLATAQTNRYVAITLTNDTGATITRTISFSNLTPGFLRIDGFQYVPGNILGGGTYEDVLFETSTFNTGGSTGWTQNLRRSYSNNSSYRTTIANDFVQFNFSGTGFAVQTEAGPASSEMEVCYKPYLAFLANNSFADSESRCVNFQNESSQSSTTISRTILGLPQGQYAAAVFNRDNGLSERSIPPVARTVPPTLVIDSITVFSDDLPPVLGVVDGGRYDQSAVNTNGDPYLLLKPDHRWSIISDRSALTASSGSYASVVDDQKRLSGRYAGPVVALRVAIEGNSRATITLDTFTKGRGHSEQLQYCIVGGKSPTDIDIACQTLNTMPTSTYQVVTVANPIGSTYTPTIFFQTLTPGFLRIDNFQVMQGNILSAGIYEDQYMGADQLIDTNGTGWQTILDNGFTNGSAIQTRNAANPGVPGSTGDFIQFEFYGTGFAIGTHLGSTGSEMRVCYQRAALFDGNFFDNTGEYCLNFQNEFRSVNLSTARTMAGLPLDRYVVGVLHQNDGQSNLTSVPTPRNPVRNPAILMVDYVEIFDEVNPTVITNNGIYNQDAALGNEPYLQLLPERRWQTIAGRAARNATEQNYAGVVDNRGRVVSNTAGQVVVMNVQVNGAVSGTPGRTTLALNTFAAGSGNTDKLLYCVVLNTALVECNTLTTMPLNNQQVITLTNNAPTPVTYSVFFQTLTPSFFRIDGFQVIRNGILTEGIYDNHFMGLGAGNLISLTGSWQLPPASGTKNTRAYGGTIIRTQMQNAEMTFAFQGGGFSIITVEDRNRLNIEVCYVNQAQYAVDGFNSAICQLNRPTVTSGKFDQYGLNFLGLQPGSYVARVRVDEAPVSLTAEWFPVDAIVIFADVTASGPLGPGMYDDTDLLNSPAVRFAPAVFWGANTRVRSGPPQGPWQLTEQQATNAGSVLQVFVEGNALTLYQEYSIQNTDNVRACLIVFGTVTNELQCNNFSQRGRGGYTTPVTFYGLGEGTHEIVFENKAARRKFSIDGLRVTP